MDFITDKKFLRLSGNMLNSHYYKHVLTGDDRSVLHTLWISFLNKGTESYSRGLLVVNMKQKTLREKFGNITYSTCNRSLQKLDKLGAIVKIESNARNNKYLIGFRTEGNDNLYLLFHLIDKYNHLVTKRIEEQKNKIENRWKDPKLEAIDFCCLDSVIRDFIVRNVNEPRLFTEKIENNQTFFEILFDRNDYYKFRFSELIRNDM